MCMCWVFISALRIIYGVTMPEDNMHSSIIKSRTSIQIDSQSSCGGYRQYLVQVRNKLWLIRFLALHWFDCMS